MSKDFGLVSGYLDPANRSWEQATWLTGRPPLEKEFNLAGELYVRQDAHQNELSSGFLFSKDYFSADIFPKSNTGDPLVEPGNFRVVTPAAPVPVANRFYFGPGQIAHLAGMLVTLRQAGAAISNEWLPIDLPAPPVGVGVKRFDLVFLEVWRALIQGDTAATPTHRDGTGKIFYNGWVDSPGADNLTNDVYDAGVGTETSNRVQIQWRIRVVSGSNLIGFPDGIDEGAIVLAQGPEAAPTVNLFTNQSANGDSGLWISTGNTNTVDGNVYAIPICAVARRNTSAFDKDTNSNGALAIAGPADSGRPDDARNDQIAEKDIIDLRKIVSRRFNLEDLLQKNFSWVMDGKLKTNWEDSQLGGGQRGTQFTNADEIGPVDTPGANLIGDFDGYQKQWSDAVAVTEAIEIVALADRTLAVNPGFWAEGDQFQIALPVASNGIIDSVINLATSSGYGFTSYMTVNLNTQTITITLVASFNTDVPLGPRTGSDIFARISVTFPGAQGMTRDPLTYKAPLVTGATLNVLEGGDNFVIEGAIPATMSDMSADSSLYRPSRTATLIGVFDHTDYVVTSRTTTTTYVPFFLESVQGIFDGVADPGKTTDLFVSFDSETGLVTHVVVPATHRSMIVDFKSKDPIPNGTQVTFYYETAAQQTIDGTPAMLNVTNVTVSVLHTSNHVYAVSGGSGVIDPAYPYVRPGQLVPVSDGAFLGEHYFNFSQALASTDFSTSAQMMQLPVRVPFAHTPYIVLQTPAADVENRTFYETVGATAYDDTFGGPAVPYAPSVFAPSLTQNIPHKVMYPCVGMLTTDTAIGKRGTLVLLIFTRTSTDSQNAVVFTDPGVDSCVGIYRMKGNPTVSIRTQMIGPKLVEVS